MKNTALLFLFIVFLPLQSHSQTMLSCRLVQGEKLAHCDISADICNAAYELNAEEKTIKQVDGLYGSAVMQNTEWKESSIYFRQTMIDDPDAPSGEKETLLRSELNRLTGEMHVRADWKFKGQQRYRVELWQCAARKPLF